MSYLNDNKLPDVTQKPPNYELPKPIRENIYKAAQDATKTLLDGIKSNPLNKSGADKLGMELAPIAYKREKETIFKGAGNSHFSFENHDKFVGFHVTTQVPGIGEKEGFPYGLSLHTRIKIEKKDNSLSFLDID